MWESQHRWRKLRFEPLLPVMFSFALSPAMCVTWAGGQAEKGKAEGGSEPGERQEGIASRRRMQDSTNHRCKAKGKSRNNCWK